MTAPVPYAITVRNIRALGKHGALPGEREREQPFDLDVELDVDLSQARRSDVLADTVDYGAVHALVVRIVAERSYVLLERLGDEILSELLRDRRVRRARLTIAKPALLAGATPSVCLVAENVSA